MCKREIGKMEHSVQIYNDTLKIEFSNNWLCELLYINYIKLSNKIAQKK